MESDLQRLNSGQVFPSRAARIVPNVFRAPALPNWSCCGRKPASWRDRPASFDEGGSKVCSS